VSSEDFSVGPRLEEQVASESWILLKCNKSFQNVTKPLPEVICGFSALITLLLLLLLLLLSKEQYVQYHR